MKANKLPFGDHRGKRCANNCCIIRHTKNGQYSITIPSNIAKDKSMEKGDKIRFTDEGMWIRMEYNKKP